MLRSVLAIVIGVIVVFVLVLVTDLILFQLFPQWYPDPAQGPSPAGVYVLTMTYGLVYAIVAGWVTGFVADRAEALHALVVGIVLLALNLAMPLANPDMAEMTASQPDWYTIGMPIIGIVGLFLGGILRQRTRRG